MVVVEHLGPRLFLSESLSPLQDCFAAIYGEEACTDRAQEERREWILGGLVALAAILILFTKYYNVLHKTLSHLLSSHS